MGLQRQMIDVPGPQGRALTIEVYSGGSGPELLFQHGAGGLLDDDPFLHRLSESFHVYAPNLPGYGESASADHLEDMLDFTLHAHDVRRALELDNPLLVGHSMGGMIAAEMAAVDPDSVDRLVLLCPAGLWIDEHPVVDILAALPMDLPDLLLHDAQRDGHLLSAGGDLSDPEFLAEFVLAGARQAATASKLLFPVPDHGLRDRLYRIRARTQVIWGLSDRLIDPKYGAVFTSAIGDAELFEIAQAGHMVQYEQTEAVLDIISRLQK